MFKNKMKMPKLFFWQKEKEPSFEQKIKNVLPFILEAAPKIMDLIRENRKQAYQQQIDSELGITSETPGEQIGKMYDFFNNLGSLGSGGVFENTISINDFSNGQVISPTSRFTENPPLPPGSATGIDNTKQDRIEVTPKSVMDELETTPLIKSFNLETLQAKIDTLKDKSKLTNQRYSLAQIKGLINRLENRKGYEKFYPFYSKFPNTTDGRIDKLLEKYKLAIKTTDLFVPTFPPEAIQVMKEYTRQTKLLCGEEPVFYVIAEEKYFKKKEEKLDPILLAQSPFGFYWQILGAWDKEMLLLSEL